MLGIVSDPPVEFAITELAGLADVAELPADRIRITRDGRVIGVLVGPDELATLDLLATPGAREATAEGLADLTAGRRDDWLTLRSDYGRGPNEPDGADG